MTNQAEGSLMEAARSGDPEALDALLKKYQPQILRFGMKMCRNPEDAKDILQETLFAAARSLHGFRGASGLSTWLYAIARSFCIKSRRRSVFAPEVVSLEEGAPQARSTPDTAPDPERALEGREIAAALEAAIAMLEPAYREVLLLRDVEGLSAAEVAEVTGASVAAVKSRLHRARRAVRNRVAPLLAPVQPLGESSSSCPDVVDLLSRHLEGEIDQHTCAEMEAHVTSCRFCQATCDSLRQTLTLCRTAPSPSVPEELQASIRRGIKTVLAQEAR